MKATLKTEDPPTDVERMSRLRREIRYFRGMAVRTENRHERLRCERKIRELEAQLDSVCAPRPEVDI